MGSNPTSGNASASPKMVISLLGDGAFYCSKQQYGSKRNKNGMKSETSSQCVFLRSFISSHFKSHFTCQPLCALASSQYTTSRRKHQSAQTCPPHGNPLPPAVGPRYKLITSCPHRRSPHPLLHMLVINSIQWQLRIRRIDQCRETQDLLPPPITSNITHSPEVHVDKIYTIQNEFNYLYFYFLI